MQSSLKGAQAEQLLRRPLGLMWGAPQGWAPSCLLWLVPHCR